MATATAGDGVCRRRLFCQQSRPLFREEREQRDRSVSLVQRKGEQEDRRNSRRFHTCLLCLSVWVRVCVCVGREILGILVPRHNALSRRRRKQHIENVPGTRGWIVRRRMTDRRFGMTGKMVMWMVTAGATPDRMTLGDNWTIIVLTDPPLTSRPRVDPHEDTE